MRRIDILLASELSGGHAPFRHGEFDVAFHPWTDVFELPLIEGALWIFIDWVLPEMSGLELCRRVRADSLTSHAHVTMVLEEDNLEDRKRALRTGADDYMVGPLARGALLDRVLGARHGEQDSTGIRLLAQGDLMVDVAAFQARFKGKPISLMPNEPRLLRDLLAPPGRGLRRAQLISALGKQEPPVDERTVDVWIGRLRRALRGAGAGNPLRTVRSLGYVFDSL